MVNVFNIFLLLQKPLTLPREWTGSAVWFDCLAVISSSQDDTMMSNRFVFVGNKLFKLFRCLKRFASLDPCETIGHTVNMSICRNSILSE